MADSMQWLTGALVALLNEELSSSGVQIDTSSGLSLSISAGGNSITLDGLRIDATNGLEGHLHVDTTNTDGLQTSLIDGFDIALTDFDLQLQNAGLTSANITAKLTVPFFTPEETIDVEVGVRHDGSLTFTLSPQQSNSNLKMTPDGLLKLSYAIGSTVSIELDIDALEFDNPSKGVYELVLGGKLLITTTTTPPTPPINWPGFDFKGLHIDNQGHVQLDGGWITLPDHTALDFYGFNLSLQKLGFGTDTSGPWIGFNGDIQLIEDVPLGGSVQGMRLNLENGHLDFVGVSISFEIPDVLSFSGDINHIAGANAPDLMQQGLSPQFVNSIATSDYPVNVFAGGVDVTILPDTMGLEVDAQFIVGKFNNTSVFFLVLDVELPVGIPLFLDIALYGMEGLFASNLRPDPTKSGETWWDWYKFAPGSQTPEYSATDIYKWLPYPQQGALALGVGATIGTEADDGYTASAGITFLLITPGPVLLLIGKAKILAKRVSNAKGYDDSSSGASFDALASYDGSTKTFDMDIDAKYSIPVVLDIEGSMALHVDGSNGDWYLALGLPPRDKRIRARIFDLFEADTYFVISNSGLEVGAYIGFNEEWSYGPLSVGVDAYMAMLAAIQWSPLVLGAGIELHGDAHLDAFGIGLGISVDALLEGRAPDPFWVHGEFSVELALSWPLPDVGASVSLTWGGDNDNRPASPLPLAHVDATLVDHVASSEHYTLLSHQPNWPPADSSITYDPEKKGYGLLNPTQAPLMSYWAGVWTAQQPISLGPPTSPPTTLTPDQVNSIYPELVPSNVPYAAVIPQDAHFTINFAHPITDQSGPINQMGFVNGTSNPPPEPPTVSPPPALPTDAMSHINLNPPAPQWVHTYYLNQVALYEYTMGQWHLVASQPPVASSPQLSGAWLSTSLTTPNALSIDNTQLKIIPLQATNSPLAIVPDGQRMYALKVVTSVESQHTDGSNSQTDGPIIEFAYFQIASGPGVGIIDPLLPSKVPIPTPSVSAPYSAQGKAPTPTGPPASAFPLGGQLLDLHTYTQWSWPDDGNGVAYYGYNLNVEFNESYVYNLYTSSPDSGGIKIQIANPFVSTGGPLESAALHMRCVDRNNQHVLLVPDAIHVPSIPQQSALASTQANLPQPPAILNTGGDIQLISSAVLSDIQLVLQPQARVYEQQQLLGQQSQANTPANAADTAAMAGSLKVQEQAALQELAARGQISLTPTQLQNPILIPPSWSSVILKQTGEEAAAQSARAIWPQTLLPGTRYTLDVVAGPLGGSSTDPNGNSGSAFLTLIAQNYEGADAITILDALEAFYTYEDSLTTLQRVQFTTSRYATCTDHLANAVEQSRIAGGLDAGKPWIAPIRSYAASIDMQSWLNAVSNGDGSSSPLALYQNSQNTYTQAQAQIASFVGGFNPKDDNLPPHLPPQPNQTLPGPQQLPATPTPDWPFPGQAGLRVNRQITQQTWTAFLGTASLLFDKVITALGRDDLASNQHVPSSPDTEMSEFVDASGRVQALLLESPEPLLWRHIWQWIALQPVSNSSPSLTVLPLWSADGTRGLLIPLQQQSSSTTGTVSGGIEADNSAGGVNAGNEGSDIGRRFPPQQYVLTISFHGNIGAEAPCIAHGERESIENITFAPLALLPSHRFRPTPQ